MPNIGLDFWILGATFFQGYYTVHDEMNERFGVAPIMNSHKIAITQGTLPDKMLPEPWHWTTKTEILAGVGTISLSIVFIYKIFPALIEWYLKRKFDPDEN